MPKHDMVEGLGASLRPVYEAIRDLLAGVARNDSSSRHRIGVLIAEVMGAQGKYGSHAVEQLARALGTNIHTLYRCAAVAGCWSRPELEALLHRTTPRGQPLSWSHLVLLAGVASAKWRSELVDQCLRDGLTVRELLVIAEARDTRRGPNGALVVLHRFVRTSERWSRTATEMHDELLAELDGTLADDADPVALIDRVIAAQEELQSSMQRQLARLKFERERFARRVDHRRGATLLVAGVRLR